MNTMCVSLSDDDKCLICGDDNIKITKCSGCKMISFYCSNAMLDDMHSGRQIHIEYCPLILFGAAKEDFKTKTTVECLLKSIVERTKILSINQSPPTSMKAFFEKYIHPKVNISELDEALLSDCFSIPLTIVNSLQRIYGNGIPRELVIYIAADGVSTALKFGNIWEIILHFLPSVENLKIVYIENTKFDVNDDTLCKECSDGNKTFSFETREFYEMYMFNCKPHLIAYLNIGIGNSIYARLRGEPRRDNFTSIVKKWRNFSCPILVTTLTEKDYLQSIGDLSINLPNFQLIYKGYNDCRPFTCHQETDSQFYIPSQFVTIYKPVKNLLNSLQQFW
ncbi:uncharacterized protein LOC122508682 [Leptopilina heterotoma]|uniref:uncharacterized protein LOC122508682 n=1 Tax=Leptopilina heterotoma TaxID=63436 RepID=UPI001CA838C3|nr:uncharacterized protein LOC122508682 [Leptopilina heterotoma]